MPTTRQRLKLTVKMDSLLSFHVLHTHHYIAHARAHAHTRMHARAHTHTHTTHTHTCNKNSTTSEKPYCDARCSAESSESFCWLTLAREGPWVTSILTISRSPFQAARWRGQLPELSEMVVEAPQRRRRFTVSLLGAETEGVASVLQNQWSIPQ